MKKIIKKDPNKILFEEVKLEECRSFYAACERCMVAFFEGDTVLKSLDGIHCPLMVRSFLFWKKQCRKCIYGGDEKSFNKYWEYAKQ